MIRSIFLVLSAASTTTTADLKGQSAFPISPTQQRKAIRRLPCAADSGAWRGAFLSFVLIIVVILQLPIIVTTTLYSGSTMIRCRAMAHLASPLRRGQRRYDWNNNITAWSDSPILLSISAFHLNRFNPLRLRVSRSSRSNRFDSGHLLRPKRFPPQSRLHLIMNAFGGYELSARQRSSGLRWRHHQQQQYMSGIWTSSCSNQAMARPFATMWETKTSMRLFSTMNRLVAAAARDIYPAEKEDEVYGVGVVSEAVTHCDENNKIDEEALYQELVSLAQEIQQLDRLYYNGNSDDNNVEVGAAEELVEDAYYDALCEREGAICRQYPHLLERWQNQSGLGVQATRYGGRVGPLAVDVDSIDIAANEAANELMVSPTMEGMNSQQRQLQRRTHLRPMLSLDNIHNTTQLLAWLERVRKRVTESATANSTKVGFSASTNGNQDRNTFVMSPKVDSRANQTLSSVSPKITIVTEPKLDGLSLSLHYVKRPSRQQGDSTKTADNNQRKSRNDGDDSDTMPIVLDLKWASTRGNGYVGQDVTAAVLDARAMQVPRSLHIKRQHLQQPADTNLTALEVRGEVFLPKSVFERYQQRQRESISLNLPETNASDKKNLRLFSNARNAASGILLRKGIRESKGNNETKQAASQDEEDLLFHLRFHAYDLILDSTTQNTSDAEWDGVFVRKFLEDSGFEIPHPAVVVVLDCQAANWTDVDIGSMLQYYEALEAHREGKCNDLLRSEYTKQPTAHSWGDYDTDGCVHKIAEFSARASLGASNRAPRWAVAHKFPAQAGVTELLNIEIQVGRTGALTPVAILKPLELSGVTVKRATMHNFAYMQQTLGGVDRIPVGAQVLVRRAGDVIPQVMSRIDRLERPTDDKAHISLSIPSTCPSCGSKTIIDSTIHARKNAGSNLTGETLSPLIRCGGPPLLCPPRAVAGLQHAFSRDALDIKGLSEARIERLIMEGMLRMPVDVFRMSEDEGAMRKLAQLSGWGNKSAQNVATTAKFVATEGVSLTRFIYSLGIRNIGIHASGLIAGAYRTVDEFLLDIDSAAALSEEDVDKGADTFCRLRVDCEAVKGIGPVILSSIADFARRPELVEAAKRLAERIRIVDDDTDLRAGASSKNIKAFGQTPFANMTIVFTGSMANLSRCQAHKLAKQMGAKATPKTITKNTDLVVAGFNGGKKLERAEELGVRIMDETAFLQLAGRI